MSQRIQLTRGKWAIVDDDDHEWLCRWRWTASEKSEGYFTAMRMEKLDTGKQRIVTMHRQIMTPNTGEIVDHINGDPLDNRRANLRICTQAQNVQNKIRNRTKTLSRYKGVYWHKQGRKWMVSIQSTYLGLYATEREAAEVYDREAIARYGEFACTNFGERSR